MIYNYERILPFDYRNWTPSYTIYRTYLTRIIDILYT